MLIHQLSNSNGNFNYNAYIYKNYLWQDHFHSNYELVYVLEGCGQISVNGKTQTLMAGESILISPYAVHSLLISESAVWVGVFSEDHITEFSNKYKHVEYSKFFYDQSVDTFLRQKLFIAQNPKKYERISYLYAMCDQLLKHAVPTGAEADAKLIGKIISYISKNIMHNITLKDISDNLGYEYHYFSDLFHRYFSMNFKAFINVLRCNKACLLLSDKEKSITDISLECGFGSIRNFNRAFKLQSGLSPSEYRNKI